MLRDKIEKIIHEATNEVFVNPLGQQGEVMESADKILALIRSEMPNKKEISFPYNQEFGNLSERIGFNNCRDEVMKILEGE